MEMDALKAQVHDMGEREKLNQKAIDFIKSVMDPDGWKAENMKKIEDMQDAVFPRPRGWTAEEAERDFEEIMKSRKKGA